MAIFFNSPMQSPSPENQSARTGLQYTEVLVRANSMTEKIKMYLKLPRIG
jgi:hypothetical protein